MSPRFRVRRFRNPFRYLPDTLVLVLALLLLAAIALLLWPSRASPQERKSYTVPFHSAEGLILLAVQLNGKSAVFLLDTGSNVSFVDMHAAGSIHFKADKVRRIGMTGCIMAHEKLSLGESELEGQPLCVADLSDISKSVGEHIDGPAGQTVLRRFSAVRIDYKTQSVAPERTP